MFFSAKVRILWYRKNVNPISNKGGPVGSMGLFLNIDGAPGLEVDGEVVFENRNLCKYYAGYKEGQVGDQPVILTC